MSGLRNNQVIDSYFANIDVGMSEKYGLKYSRYQIKHEFSEFLQLNEIDGTPFYRQIVLLDDKGNEIVSVANTKADSTDINSPEFLRIRHEGITEGVLSGYMEGYTYTIFYCKPIIYKGNHRGKLIAFINHSTFFPTKHMSESNSLDILLIPKY
jgi:hypothetical protein